MISSVNLSGMEKSVSANDNKVVKQNNKTEKIAKDEDYIVDIGSSSEKKVIYDKPSGVKPDMKTIEQLKKEADDALKPLRKLVEELLRKQGLSFKDATFTSDEDVMVEVDDATRAEAERLISEDGAYGIENTANRLFEFAKALSGGDKSKLDELKAAIEKGYKAAESDFGGELPEICKKTLQRTMEKLDQWAASEENETNL